MDVDDKSKTRKNKQTKPHESDDCLGKSCARFFGKKISAKLILFQIDEQDEMAEEEEEGPYAVGTDGIDRLTRALGYEICEVLKFVKGTLQLGADTSKEDSWKARLAAFAVREMLRLM
jgi:hypothetical protein